MKPISIVLLAVSLSSCAALRGKDAVIVIDTAACALKCAIEQARAKGDEETAQRLEAIARDRAAHTGAP
jgi:hypothetical protein